MERLETTGRAQRGSSSCAALQLEIVIGSKAIPAEYSAARLADPQPPIRVPGELLETASLVKRKHSTDLLEIDPRHRDRALRLQFDLIVTFLRDSIG